MITAAQNLENRFPLGGETMLNKEEKPFYDETRAAELAALVRSARAGHGEAMAEVCRRFSPLVASLAGRAHLRTIREEAVTVGWLGVVEAVQGCPERLLTRFPGYVKRYVTYKIWNLFKHSRRVWQHEAPEEDCEQPGTDEMALRLDLKAALQSLPLRWRKIIEWNIIAGLPLRVIADRLGVSPQMVQKLRQKALSRLRRRL